MTIFFELGSLRSQSLFFTGPLPYFFQVLIEFTFYDIDGGGGANFQAAEALDTAAFIDFQFLRPVVPDTSNRAIFAAFEASGAFICVDADGEFCNFR